MSKKLLEKIQKTAEGIYFLNRKGFLIGSQKKIWDIFPYAETIQGFREAQDSGFSMFQIEEKENHYLFKIFRIEDDLFLMQRIDITCEKKLGKIKKDLVSTLSHELRTPITVIRGNVEYLLSYMDCEEREVLEEIHEKTLKMIEILSGLEKLVSKEKELRECHLKEVILSALKGFHEKARRKGIELKTSLEEISVPCERILVEQLIRNLIDNAIKFTKKGEVEVVLKATEKAVLLIVRDTGIGIKEEFKNQIFQKYFKSPESDGHGIGLSVVKEIVKYHGWEIEVESEEGEGTTFTIRISL